MRRRIPGQIADDIVQSLAELIADRTVLRRLFRARLEAYLLGHPMPAPLCRRTPCAAWAPLEAATQYAADVRDSLRAGEAAVAWKHAAEASYWHGVAVALLRPTGQHARLRSTAQLDALGRHNTALQTNAGRLRAEIERIAAETCPGEKLTAKRVLRALQRTHAGRLPGERTVRLHLAAIRKRQCGIRIAEVADAISLPR